MTFPVTGQQTYATLMTSLDPVSKPDWPSAPQPPQAPGQAPRPPFQIGTGKTEFLLQETQLLLSE